MHLGLKNRPFEPHNLIPVPGNPVPVFQMAPRLKLLMSSGSKKNEPRYTCLSEAKASHSQRMWAKVSSAVPHLLHKRLLASPIKWRCLLRVLCPVRGPVTTLVYVLLKDNSLILAVWMGPKSTLKLVSEHYQDLATLPNDGYPSRFLFFFLYSAYYRPPRMGQIQQTFEKKHLLQACQRFHFLILQQAKGPKTAPQCAR